MCAKLFRSVLSFGKRYLNHTYSVTLFLNMGRLINAESELNELFIVSKDLLKEINFLRLQIACYVVFIVKKGLKERRKWKER